jgi:hypothetical protein
MDFSTTFPVTTWLWRRFTSRRALKTSLFLLVGLLLIGIPLRIHAFLLARKFNRVLSEMSQLQSGTTSRAQLMARLPELHPPIENGAPAACDVDECLESTIGSSTTIPIALSHVPEIGRGFILPALNWIGLRYGTLFVSVRLKSGTVSGYGYQILLWDGSSNHPGAVFVNANQGTHLGDWNLSSTDDESPDYSVGHYFKWPKQHTGIVFMKDVSPTLKRHAFDVELQCFWSIAGCRLANQLLPMADEDKTRIEQAAEQRLRSDNPCPERILPRRVRDTNNIILMQVTSVGQTVHDEPRDYIFAKFKLLGVLKGELDDRLLQDLGVATTIGFYDPPMKNPALLVLKPGQRVLVFSDSSLYIDSPCEMMAVSDLVLINLKNNLQTLNSNHDQSSSFH